MPKENTGSIVYRQSGIEWFMRAPSESLARFKIVNVARASRKIGKFINFGVKKSPSKHCLSPQSRLDVPLQVKLSEVASLQV